MQPQEVPPIDWFRVLAVVALVVMVVSGTTSGFVWASESRLWAGFAALAVTSGVASYFLGSSE